jgi:hypothetical protein
VLCGNVYPNYAKDLNSAWVVFEAIERRGFHYRIDRDAGNKKTTASFWKGSKSGIVNPTTVTNEHPPTAILRAAAMALGVLND